MGVKSTAYGPNVGSSRSNAFLCALTSTAAAMSACLNRNVRSSPSATIAPGGVREEPLLEERRARRRVVRELLGVAHVRLGLAVRDLGRLRHGLALGELLRARVELLLEALLSSRHVLDHVVGGGMRRSRDGRVERLGRARGGVEASFLLRRLVGAVVQGGGDHRAGGRARHPAERARRRRRETRERARRRLPWSFAERR